MKLHVIEAPFFSGEGQFEEGKKTLCVGIEVSALKSYGEYRVYIGNNREIYYDISFQEAFEIYKTHGENAIWKKNNKQVFILPVSSFRYGKESSLEVCSTQESSKLHEKNGDQLELF